MTENRFFCMGVYLKSLILESLGLFEKTSVDRLLAPIPESDPMREKS
jgi:hypothetical protein